MQAELEHDIGRPLIGLELHLECPIARHGGGGCLAEVADTLAGQRGTGALPSRAGEAVVPQGRRSPRASVLNPPPLRRRDSLCRIA